jgi:hypothetical protein
VEELDLVMAGGLLAVFVVCGRIHSLIRMQGWGRPANPGLKNKAAATNAAGILKGLAAGFLTSFN